MEKRSAPTGNDWRLEIVQYDDLERVDHRALLDAMFGKRQEIASVLVLGFLPRNVCRDALRAIGTTGFEAAVNPIKSDNGRPVERIGPNQSRFSSNKDGYFEAQKTSGPTLEAIAAAMRLSIVDRLKVVMSGLFGKRLVTAREGGKPLTPTSSAICSAPSHMWISRPGRVRSGHSHKMALNSRSVGHRHCSRRCTGAKP